AVLIGDRADQHGENPHTALSADRQGPPIVSAGKWSGGRVRIAQVALLTDSGLPEPSSNAGRAAVYLVEELVGEHEVTLFASERWETSAELVRLRRMEGQESLAQFQRRMVRSALRGERRFDILHLHCDRPSFPSSGQIDAPCVVTLHAPCDVPDRIAA